MTKLELALPFWERIFQPVIAMEYLDGMTLKHKISEIGGGRLLQH